MRIPEAFFPLINFAMKIALRSPLHFVVSSSILLITFRGRRTQREFTTPVRYLREGDVIRIFSSPSANWWRNLRGGVDVSITMKGRTLNAQAAVLESSATQKLELFRAYLAQFPGDAAYHGIKPTRRHPQPNEVLESVLDDVTIVEVKLL